MGAFDKPPVLNGHKTLYKGRRYWVFEINNETPFQNYEGVCQFLVFDKAVGCVCAWGNYGKNEILCGYIQYGQGCIDFESNSPKDFVEKMVKWYKWIERTEK
jgi:hypothetical protein